MTSNETIEVLKPCPFCGGLAQIDEQQGDERTGYAATAYIGCAVCRASIRREDQQPPGPPFYALSGTGLAEAITAWNTRPQAVELKVTQEDREVEAVARALLQRWVEAADDTWELYRHSDSWKLLEQDACAAIAALNSTRPQGEGELAGKIARYLEIRDNRLLASDGPCRDTLEGCEKALRDVYLIATGQGNPSP